MRKRQRLLYKIYSLSRVLQLRNSAHKGKSSMLSVVAGFHIGHRVDSDILALAVGVCGKFKICRDYAAKTERTQWFYSHSVVLFAHLLRLRPLTRCEIMVFV